MTRSRSRVLLVVAMALALALAGCSFGDGTTTTDAEIVPDGAEAERAYEDLGNVTGDLRVEVAYGNRTTAASFRFAADVGTRRVRERVTAPANRSGNVFVSNTDAYWRYDASRDVAAKYPHGESTFESTFGTDSAGFGAFLEAAFDAAAADDDATVSNLPAVGVGPAPTVPSGDAADGGGDADASDDETVGPSVRPTANVSEYAVRYAGTDSVAGRDVHVLAVEPANPDAVDAENLSVTYYVDRETYFPVKVLRQAVVDGTEWRHEMTFSNVRYDADVPASTYEYDPDPGTDVVDYVAGVVQFPSREALAENSSVPLPEPSVPEGYEFASAAGIELGTSGAQVVYSNDSAVLVAGRYVDDAIVTDREREVAESVTVNGHRALYADLGRTQAVYVYCGDYVVSVAGVGDVPKETVLELAASLDCGENDSG